MLSLPLMVGAFVAGFLMFLAPCTLPIVPGYLAFIAGNRQKVLRNAAAFVLGFSIIFILLGASAGLFGIVVGSWRFVLGRIGGVLIILFGLTMLGVFEVPFLSRERHIRLPGFITVGHPSGSFIIGALFALGWSPSGLFWGASCLSPQPLQPLFRGRFCWRSLAPGSRYPFWSPPPCCRTCRAFLSRRVGYHACFQ